MNPMLASPKANLQPSRKLKAAAWQGFVLAGWILMSFSAGLIGSQFRPGEWYAELSKPSWTPPGWVFAPVWSTLYLLMGIAAWLVWRRGGWAQHRTPLMLFTVQLILNAGWSWIFFGLHRPGWAFFEIVLLAFAILLTMRNFARISRGAAWLLAPYFAWVGFASALNFALWRMNP